MAYRYLSWGRYPRVRQCVKAIEWMSDPLMPEVIEQSPNGFVLPYGMGRSYGDSCLNADGLLLSTERLRHFMSFDPGKGLLCAEAGATLSEVLEFAVPRGFFLPVTPGTRFVTLGGAVANDIHGKNHHKSGTFGRHVTRLMLMRSDGTRVILSPDSYSTLFKATVGGLGLTGLILAVELKLRPIESPFIRLESIKFENLDEFFEISASSDVHFEHTVAWLDCVGSGKDFGRGIFMRGNHACASELPPGLQDKQRWVRYEKPKEIFSIPIDFPGFALNKLSVKAFNAVYYHKQRQRSVISYVPYEPFFYPLDAVGNWNRIYGKRGLFQFQCMVPSEDRDPIKRLLAVVVESGRASFLAVLKEFGSIDSPGMLSFPRKGVTLCMDLPNQGEATLELLSRLEAMVVEFGGAMYPAKDACMSGASFRRFYPGLENFVKHIDPKFSSSFWRRVTA